MNQHLLRLYARNRNTPGRRIEVVSADGADEATVYIYDYIVDSESEAEWWGGVSAEAFVKQLAGIKASTIHLRINSPGGNVFGARAMETALRQHKARVVAHIDGLAASAASFLMLAADEIEMSSGSMIMIHKAWGFALGNSDDMRATADLLAKIDDTLVASYAAHTEQEPDTIRDWMTAETWFTADEALAAGFIDRIDGADAQASMAWDITAYVKGPQIKPDEAPTQQAVVPSEAWRVAKAQAQVVAPTSVSR